jgi:hypothetical protein
MFRQFGHKVAFTVTFTKLYLELLTINVEQHPTRVIERCHHLLHAMDEAGSWVIRERAPQSSGHLGKHWFE